MNGSPRPGIPENYRLIEPPSAFADLVGPVYVWDWDGAHRCAFIADERHCNSRGAVHGGMLMAFADIGFSVLRQLESDEASTSVTFTFQFVQPGRVGDLIEARIRIVRRTGSLNFICGELFSGDIVLLTSSTVEKRFRNKEGSTPVDL